MRIDSITPSVGALAGDTVEIQGVGLASPDGTATQVTFGERQVSAETVVPNGTLTAVVPEGEAVGFVDVLVTTASTDTTKTEGFFYYGIDGDGFALYGVAPNRGDVPGGTPIDIAGQGLTSRPPSCNPAYDCIVHSTSIGRVKRHLAEKAQRMSPLNKMATPPT